MPTIPFQSKCVTIIMAVVCLCGDAARAAELTSPERLFEGFWIRGEYIHHGQGEDFITTLAVKDGVVVMRNSGRSTAKAVLKIDPDEMPVHFTLDVSQKLNGDFQTSWQGLYKMIDRDEMLLCWSTGGNSRPTEFAADDAGKIHLAKWKRVKPDQLRLAGEWQVSAASVAGEELKRETDCKWRFVGTWEHVCGGYVILQPTALPSQLKPLMVGAAPQVAFNLAQDRAPREFSFTVPQASLNDAVGATPSLGIYQLSENEAEFCFAMPGKPRPTELNSTRENGCVLIKLRRLNVGEGD